MFHKKQQLRILCFILRFIPQPLSRVFQQEGWKQGLVL